MAAGIAQASQDAIVARGADLMSAAVATVRVASLAAHWDPLEVIASGGSRLLDTEKPHDFAPLPAMRFTASAVAHVDNIMRDLMRHGVVQAVLRVTRKQLGVIADQALLLASHVIAPGTP